jgi:hypothetical protein
MGVEGRERISEMYTVYVCHRPVEIAGHDGGIQGRGRTSHSGSVGRACITSTAYGTVIQAEGMKSSQSNREYQPPGSPSPVSGLDPGILPAPAPATEFEAARARLAAIVLGPPLRAIPMVLSTPVLGGEAAATGEARVADDGTPCPGKEPSVTRSSQLSREGPGYECDAGYAWRWPAFM